MAVLSSTPASTSTVVGSGLLYRALVYMMNLVTLPIMDKCVNTGLHSWAALH